jgi:alpha-tubulin suppressor-like RCC1 family protein
MFSMSSVCKCSGQTPIFPRVTPIVWANVQVSAGGNHTVLLRSDGHAVACGQNIFGQCNVPPLAEGMTYTQVRMGRY